MQPLQAGMQSGAGRIAGRLHPFPSSGKSEVIGGTGKFSEARSIDELFGSYVQSEAHAGAGKSASAQAMTKGEISLALAGTGRGVDIGFAFGKFTIER